MVSLKEEYIKGYDRAWFLQEKKIQKLGKVLKEIIKNHPPIHKPMGGADPYKAERLYLKHAKEVIQS